MPLDGGWCIRGALLWVGQASPCSKLLAHAALGNQYDSQSGSDGRARRGTLTLRSVNPWTQLLVCIYTVPWNGSSSSRDARSRQAAPPRSLHGCVGVVRRGRAQSGALRGGCVYCWKDAVARVRRPKTAAPERGQEGALQQGWRASDVRAAALQFSVGATAARRKFVWLLGEDSAGEPLSTPLPLETLPWEHRRWDRGGRGAARAATAA